MMVSVILLSMLMRLLSTLIVVRHLISGNSWNWLLNLNLISETLWTGAGSGLLFSILEKLNWFFVTGLITLVLLMWKWMDLFLSKMYLLRCWGCLSLLNWIGALTSVLLLKPCPRKLDLWFILWRFLFRRLLCISIDSPYSHAWNTVVMSGLVLLTASWNFYLSYKNRYIGLLVLHLLPFLKPWVIIQLATFWWWAKASREVASEGPTVPHISLFYRCYFSRCSSELAQLVSLPYCWGRSTLFSEKLHDFSVTFLDLTRISMSTVSFLAQLDPGIISL